MHVSGGVGEDDVYDLSPLLRDQSRHRPDVITAYKRDHRHISGWRPMAKTPKLGGDPAYISGNAAASGTLALTLYLLCSICSQSPFLK